MAPVHSQARAAVLPLSALLSGAIALGSSPILVRLSELEPTATAFYRVALAVPAFVPFMLWRQKPAARVVSSRARASVLAWLTGAGALFAIDLACLHWSLRHTSVANATLFLNFAPFFVALGTWVVFRQRPSQRTAISLVIATSGMALLVGGACAPTATRVFGDALGVAAGAAYGGYLMVVSRFRSRAPTSIVMGVTTFSCAVLLLPAALAMGESLVPRTAWAWSILLALALLTHSAGQGLLVYAMKYLPASTSSITLLLQPVAAACCAWIIFAETLGFWQIVGGGMVLFGIALCQGTTPSPVLSADAD